MWGLVTSMNKLGPVLMIATGLALGGCSMVKQFLSPDRGADPAPATEEAAAPDTPDAPVEEAVAESTLLVYEWDTGYSSFLSPPIEVRRQARADCQSEGYEVAVVETMMLDGNIATAHFICRGDFE